MIYKYIVFFILLLNISSINAGVSNIPKYMTEHAYELKIVGVSSFFTAACILLIKSDRFKKFINRVRKKSSKEN